MIKSQRYPETGLFKDVYRAINRLIDDLNYLKLNPGINTQIHRSPWGSYVKGNSGGTTTTTSTDVDWFSVRTVEDDYLDCFRMDANGVLIEDEKVKVAKPTNLRKSVWNGNSFGVELYSGISGTSQSRGVFWTDIGLGGTQTLMEPYILGSIIYAIRLDTKTGLIVGMSPDLEQVKYLDLNIDARRFVTTARSVQVCKPSGKLSAMAFHAGEPPTT